MEETKKLSLLHCDLCDEIDKLKSLESMLEVFYHSMISNPDSDIWQNDPDKYLDMLIAPYITILNSIKSIRCEIDDIHNSMDDAIFALEKLGKEGR